MSKVLVTESYLEDIADAIRTKTGGTDTYTPGEMAAGGGGIEQENTYATDLNTGYVGSGTWYYEGQTSSYYSDVYEVIQNHAYIIRLGSVVGTRFRAMFSTRDTSTATTNVAGTVVGTGTNNPSAFAYMDTIFKPTSNGYLTIGKSNNNESGIETFVYDISSLMGLS